MFRKPQYIALWVVVLLTLVILNLPSQTANRLKLAIGSLFVPLFGLARTTQQAAGESADTLVPRRELIRQNAQIQRESESLRLELRQAQEATRENARLRDLYNWQKKTPWKLKLASVVLREPSNWWRTVQIDLGSRDGMRLNFPVLTPEGLVGRISSVVSLTRSQVVLLGDPNCRVSALIENDSRDHGVLLNSSSSLDNALVVLGFLPRGSNLKPGQNVVTSGMGGIFPKGIPIGRIVDFQSVEYGLGSEARLKLTANLSALEEVWVICNERD